MTVQEEIEQKFRDVATRQHFLDNEKKRRELYDRFVKQIREWRKKCLCQAFVAADELDDLPSEFKIDISESCQWPRVVTRWIKMALLADQALAVLTDMGLDQPYQFGAWPPRQLYYLKPSTPDNPNWRSTEQLIEYHQGAMRDTMRRIRRAVEIMWGDQASTDEERLQQTFREMMR